MNNEICYFLVIYEDFLFPITLILRYYDAKRRNNFCISIIILIIAAGSFFFIRRKKKREESIKEIESTIGLKIEEAILTIPSNNRKLSVVV